ncbi:type II toxin-antitoxin system HicB family antitoxin [Sandaracinus amylolyticus]|uniref:HicB-like antitoxin of toxin-antitoxin system domain-containing protein n=1 Tax=Sandaracinus amylolyticus TaxID=927083 RepID=A0A0F6W305_9BACT|nr:type II toxin-antitoxin system HicB family antitoxin [Sandaracinus amylolyticus]AKF06098.1 hypothetical protein DB32_003247 [Sandaracinus amylolyticus]
MTRKQKTKQSVARVTAVYEPAGEPGWWTVTVPEVPGCLSQGRGIAQARERIREALGLFRHDADDVEIVDDVRLPVKARRAVDAYQKAREAAESAQTKASERSREAVRVLVDELGFTTRDAGVALGVSQARVAQLARE